MAIRIETKATNAPLIGRSHWWGAPDLPADIPYPTVTLEDEDGNYEEPLTFICQVRCEEIAKFDSDHILPQTGILYFFAPLDYFLGETDSPLDYHEPPIVLYSDNLDDLHPYDIHWEGTTESIFHEAEEMVFSLDNNKTGDGIRMLGEPYQDEVREAHTGDVCLLQIDEEDRWGLRFYDCGMYYIFMHLDDLRKGHWGKAMGELFYY